MPPSERVTFAAGSFWGVQAAFRPLALSTRAGYMGGNVGACTPEQVATGSTGHAEVVEVTFDPKMNPFVRLLLCFWQMHDGSRRPRVGATESHPYRSVIFFHTSEQDEMAREWLADPAKWLARTFPTASRVLSTPAAEPDDDDDERARPSPWRLKTEILPATTFWPAPPEEQHRLHLLDPLRFESRLGLGDVPARRPAAAGQHGTVESLPAPPPPDRSPIIDLHPAFASLAPVVLRTAAALDDTHLDAIVAALNRSIRTAPAMTKPTSTDGEAEAQLQVEVEAQPERQRIPLGFATAYVNEAATESHVTWAWPGIFHVFTTNFRPGNFLPRHGAPNERQGYESWIGDGATDGTMPVVQVFGPAGGMVGDSVLTGAPQSLLLQPRPPLPPASDADPDPARVGKWHEHVTDAHIAPLANPNGLHRTPGSIETHDVRWHAGELLLEEHPGNLEHERALMALGAHRCGCFDVYELWRPEWLRQGWHAGSVLAALQRDLIRPALLASTYQRLWSRRMATTSDGPLPDPSDCHKPDWQPSLEARRRAGPIVPAIESMPLDLRQRWLLGALVELEPAYTSGQLDQLDRINFSAFALTPLGEAVSQSLWRWCRYDPSISYGHAVHRLLDRDETPIAQGFVDGDTAHVLVGVPFEWIFRVWTRGLAEVEGHLLLEVNGPADATTLDVLAAGWTEDDGPGTARLLTRRTTITWTGDRWELARSQ